MGVQFSGWNPETESFVDHESVDFSMSNASLVLDALGLDPVDMSGALPADDFLGRVLMAEAVAPHDEGLPSYDDTQATGPTWIECGRREGYLQERLAELRELAEAAKNEGAEVSWA
jgi:hypothetical protein